MHVSVFSIVKAISVVLGQATGAESVSISSVIAKSFSASLRLAWNFLIEVSTPVDEFDHQ